MYVLKRRKRFALFIGLKGKRIRSLGKIESVAYIHAETLPPFSPQITRWSHTEAERL